MQIDLTTRVQMVESKADAFLLLRCLNHCKICIEVIRQSSHILTMTI